MLGKTLKEYNNNNNNNTKFITRTCSQALSMNRRRVGSRRKCVEKITKTCVKWNGLTSERPSEDDDYPLMYKLTVLWYTERMQLKFFARI